MLRFVEEIQITRCFGNTPRIFRAICIAAQILYLLIFPQFTVTLSEFGHLSELGAFTLSADTKVVSEKTATRSLVATSLLSEHPSKYRPHVFFNLIFLVSNCNMDTWLK